MTTITVPRELLEQALSTVSVMSYAGLTLKERLHASHVRTAITAALAQQAEPSMTAYEAGQHVRTVFAAAPTTPAEPVGILWQHGETGRTRVEEPGQIFSDNRGWHRVGPLYLHPAPTQQEADALDASAAFDVWWDAGDLMKSNPYNEGTPAFWAWEGWCAAKGASK